ncbi:MAG: molybdenum cofactor guanylyltransferase [Chloroflexi bacterium]|nr:molybdenum cofactor guanylyltransferase [Chloroflexota bacterium]
MANELFVAGTICRIAYNYLMLISLVIQAGGESRRMGQDKALLPFLGKPLIERVIQRLKPLADEILITTNQPENYRFLNLPAFPDVWPGQGALGGLYTALLSAGQPLVAVVACDMPFASLPLLRAQVEAVLQSGADGAVPQSPEGYEPFHAVYRRETCLPAVKAALEAGQKRLISWFPAVRLVFFSPEEVSRYDLQRLAFMNANTIEEFRRAEELAEEY